MIKRLAKFFFPVIDHERTAQQIAEIEAINKKLAACHNDLKQQVSQIKYQSAMDSAVVSQLKAEVANLSDTVEIIKNDMNKKQNFRQTSEAMKVIYKRLDM